MAVKKKVKKSKRTSTKGATMLSQRARTMLGTAIGGGIGAVVGQMFAEDPEVFLSLLTENANKIGWSINGVPVGQPVDPTTLWWQRKVTADWYVDHDGDRTQHAFALCSKGPPGQSACGDVWLDAPHGPGRKDKKRCKQCVSILKLAGYTVHKDNIITGGVGPLEQGPPDPLFPRPYPSPATRTTPASAPRAKKSTKKKTKK